MQLKSNIGLGISPFKAAVHYLNYNKFYFIFIICLLVGQIVLISSRDIVIFPEMYFYPWLISKHVVLYKDIFINHGFSLYLLLSFLPFDRYVFSFRVFYILIQSINLLLILLVIKRYSSKLAIIFSGIFYVTLNFITTENAFWDESFLTTLSVVIIYLIKSSRKYHWIIGLAIGLMTFIKPTSIILVIPTLIFTKNWKIIFYLIATIIIGFTYLLNQHSVLSFIDNVIFYNIFYGKYFSSFNDTSVGNFFNYIFVLVGVLFLASFFQKTFKRSIVEFSFLIFTSVFLFPRMQFVHASPFIALFTIYGVSVILSTKKHIKLFLVILISVFYLGFFYKKIKHEYVFLLSNRKEYLESQISNDLLADVKKTNISINNLYVFGLNTDIYYVLQKIPVVRFVAIYPWVSAYYNDIENETIKEIVSKKVNMIIVPKPKYISYANMHNVDMYINTHFYLFKKNLNYEIYIIR